jgi:hypothetical protein
MRFLLLAIVFGLAGVLAGVVSSEIFRRSPPVVVLEVSNSAGKTISNLEVTTTHGLTRLADIASGETRSLAFYVPGESSFKIHIMFADRTILEGGVGYIWSGGKWSATITAEAISSQFIGEY